MKIVINADINIASFVQTMHVLLEVWSMAISISVTVCQEEISVYHLMEQGLYEVFPRSQLQQRLTEGNVAETSPTLVPRT